MVANEVHPKPIAEDNRTEQWQDYYNEEEAEETLSFCDLPIYSGSFESDDRFSSSSFSKEDYQSSTDDQDLFEFFSGDFSTDSSTCVYADNIFFCGKLLPYKIPPVHSQETPHKLHQINTKQPPPPPPKKKKSFFQWRSKSLSKSKTSKDNNNSTNNKKKNYSEHQQVSGSKNLALPASNKCSANKKYGYSMKKVSILTSPATKSRWWHLFLFGLARFPTEMKLSDMKSRQHRRAPSSSTLFPSFDEADKGKDVKACETSSIGKGLWSLLRVLGFRNDSHANTVVKASFGCIPRV